MSIARGAVAAVCVLVAFAGAAIGEAGYDLGAWIFAAGLTAAWMLLFQERGRS